MDIVSLLVFLIVIGLAFWAVRTIAGAFVVPAAIVTLVHVALVIYAVLWLLESLGLWNGGPSLRLR
jgi:uncharacterized membrane protein (DUF2068 family)